MRDLVSVGMVVEDVWDLVNTTIPYRIGLPVLVHHLSRPYGDGVLEGIARALAVKDARPFAWDLLITSIEKRSFPKPVMDGIMVAISAMASPADLLDLTNPSPTSPSDLAACFWYAT